MAPWLSLLQDLPARVSGKACLVPVVPSARALAWGQMMQRLQETRPLARRHIARALAWGQMMQRLQETRPPADRHTDGALAWGQMMQRLQETRPPAGRHTDGALAWGQMMQRLQEARPLTCQHAARALAWGQMMQKQEARPLAHWHISGLAGAAAGAAAPLHQASIRAAQDRHLLGDHACHHPDQQQRHCRHYLDHFLRSGGPVGAERCEGSQALSFADELHNAPAVRACRLEH